MPELTLTVQILYASHFKTVGAIPSVPSNHVQRELNSFLMRRWDSCLPQGLILFILQSYQLNKINTGRKLVPPLGKRMKWKYTIYSEG